jgi:FkbM family methyltransferase
MVSELVQGRVPDFLDIIEGSSIEELIEYLWPDGAHDPSDFLAPVAARHFSTEATQEAWLRELSDSTDRYRALYERLEDETSRATLASVFRYRLSLDGRDLTETHPGPIYFHGSVLPRSEGAAYVDAGAYDGDTVLDFVRLYGDYYRSIHAFEPFSKSFEAAQRTCAPIRNAQVVQKGLWNESTTLKVAGEKKGVTAVMDFTPEEVQETIETVALDDYMQVQPTYIKMDIEGAERRALAGAERVIKAGLPALAICVYHLIDDLGAIPNIISGMSDNYTFLLRNYKTTGSGEVVLYARASQ